MCFFMQGWWTFDKVGGQGRGFYCIIYNRHIIGEF